jgi:hypothetical protein
MGILNFGMWLRSIMHPQMLPVFRWNDPLPAVVGSAQLVRYAGRRLLTRLVGRSHEPLHQPRLPQPLPGITKVTSDIHTCVDTNR